MFKLLVGLGNPGEKYSDTRHNVGYQWISMLASHYKVSLATEKKLQTKLAKITVNGSIVRLATPNTYMNESGIAVAAICQYYQINPTEIFVVHDELDLSVGTLQLKHAGGHAGHNGLRNIIQQLNSSQFYRLRVGIGRSLSTDSVSDYVLSAPSRAEKTLLHEAINHSLVVLPLLFAGKWQQAVQQLHQKNII